VSLQRFMSIAEVTSVAGISRSQIYSLIAAGEFPKQVKVGTSSLWLESEIQQWQEQRISERDTTNH
jgi:prophage regulatory protein